MKNLIRQFFLVVYRTIVLMLRYLQSHSPPSVACKLQNIFLALHGSKVRYSYDKIKGLYVASELELVRYFGDMCRGFHFYARSIKKRGSSLAASYCLSHIKFSNDDLVIDCGANYGDLYLFLKGKIEESNYIAIEPGPVEYQCLLNSIPDARILNLGLSNSDDELDFYLF